MKAMSVKYKMLSDKNNIDNDRLYRPAALSELLEAWLAVFESRRPHRGDGKHNRQSPDTADTYQNWPGMINLSHRFTQIFTDFIWLTKTMKTPCCWCKSLTSHRCCSRLQILERAQIFSATYIITLRALHQPQGDKQKINIISLYLQQHGCKQ